MREERKGSHLLNGANLVVSASEHEKESSECVRRALDRLFQGDNKERKTGSERERGRGDIKRRKQVKERKKELTREIGWETLRYAKSGVQGNIGREIV